MTKPLLDVRGVSRSFGGVVALDDVSFSVARGSLVGLIGSNGAGKTTLINVISGAESPSTGRISFGDDTSGPWSLERSVDRGIVRTYQTPRAFFGLTVAENLRIAKTSPSARLASSSVVDATLALEEGFGRWYRHRVSDLPFGVLRSLSITLALCTAPSILLMDEPCVGLATEEVDVLGETIRTLNANGLTILLVEHNVSFVMRLVDSVLVLHKGAVMFNGSVEDCQTSEAVQDAYLGRSG